MLSNSLDSRGLATCFPPQLRATSHTSQGSWQCNYKDSWFSAKAHTTDIVYRNLCQAHLLEVDFTHIPADHETLFVIYHVGIHVEFSFMILSLNPLTFTFWCEVTLASLDLLRPMRDLRMQWSWAFSLVCEVALSHKVHFHGILLRHRIVISEQGHFKEWWSLLVQQFIVLCNISRVWYL